MNYIIISPHKGITEWILQQFPQFIKVPVLSTASAVDVTKAI